MVNEKIDNNSPCCCCSSLVDNILCSLRSEQRLQSVARDVGRRSEVTASKLFQFNLQIDIIFTTLNIMYV